jgi:uncharacterized Zn finger protein
MKNEKQIKCPNCGEEENFHFNYDYSKKDMPIVDILCNKCGQIFKLEKEKEKEQEYYLD